MATGIFNDQPIKSLSQNSTVLATGTGNLELATAKSSVNHIGQRRDLNYYPKSDAKVTAQVSSNGSDWANVVAGDSFLNITK